MPLVCASASRVSIFVLVLVFVVAFLFYNVQLDGIESHHFEVCPTFLARHYFALVCVQIHVDISITFRASSGRHSFFLPAFSDRQGYAPVGRASPPCKQPNQSTRERWNLQQSFSLNVGPVMVTFLCRNFVLARRVIYAMRNGVDFHISLHRRKRT